MPLTTPRIQGLSALAGDFDAALCDVWGVVHNGVALFPGVADALVRFRAGGRTVLLLTNAPRPSGPIHRQLASLGLPREAYDDIVTSGDCTRAMLETRPGLQVHHIGPERDLPLFEGLDLTLTEPEAADLAVVTGLVDDTVETPEDYRARLETLLARKLPLVCANPDLVVERGGLIVYCAGAIGRLYQDMGGAVTLYGKPYAPVYAMVYERLAAMMGRPVDRSRMLAIGDGLPTDIRGAHLEGIPALFVTAGIHAHELGPVDDPDPALVEAILRRAGVSAIAHLPHLVW